MYYYSTYTITISNNNYPASYYTIGHYYELLLTLNSNFLE